MFGFLLGTFCLMGLFAVGSRWFYHHHHWHHRHGHGADWGSRYGRHSGSHGRRGEWGGPRFMGEGFGRAAAEVIKRRLRVDEDQEDIVDHAMKDVRSAVQAYVEMLKGSRAEVGAAFRGEAVDEAALAGIFARHDEALGRARREVLSAFKQIHAVLTPEQRSVAADWVGSTETRWV